MYRESVKGSIEFTSMEVFKLRLEIIMPSDDRSDSMGVDPTPSTKSEAKPQREQADPKASETPGGPRVDVT